LAVVKAALRARHDEEIIENKLSGYYLAENIARTYDGMMIALPDEEWTIFQSMGDVQRVLPRYNVSVNIRQGHQKN